MKIIADLHVHSIASGHAFNTIDELTKSAKEKGLELIAITDHGPALPGAANYFYFKNLGIVPDTVNGVIVLKGIECNILNNVGELDLASEHLAPLDIVLAGFHEACYQNDNINENTKTIISVMESSRVNIIAHIGNPNYPVDYKEVIAEAVRNNVAIEINNASLTFTRAGSKTNCMKVAEICADLNAMVSISSDAHIRFHLGKVEEAVKLAEQAGIQEKNILNLSVDRIKSFISR